MTIQNAEEAEEERELDLISMDETPKIPISMPVASLPPFPSMPNTSPPLFLLGPCVVSMVMSSTLLGEQESELSLEILHGIGSRLNGAQLGTRTEIKPIVAKGKGFAYANSV